MIAVDTNVLVHAHRADSPWHKAAYRCLESLREVEWAIPWPCGAARAASIRLRIAITADSAASNSSGDNLLKSRPIEVLRE